MRRPTIIAAMAAIACVSCVSTNKLQNFRDEVVTSSDAIEWEQFGPGMSGYCEYAWCHPTDPNTLFLGPDMHVAYGTWDGSESWQSIKDYDGNSYEMSRLRTMDFSHQDENFGLAMPWDGCIYKTTDKGRNWELFSDMGKRCNIIAVDPSNDQNWYIGAGDYWNVKSSHRTKAKPHGEMNMSEGYGYIATYADYGYIARSTDGGKSWEKVTAGLPAELDVVKIVVDPRDSNIVIAATSHGFYRSEDQGKSWKSVGEGLPHNLPRDLSYHFDGENFTLFTVEQTAFEPNGKSIKSIGGVFKSVDGGLTWSNITGNLAFDMSQTSYDKADGWNTQNRFYFRTIAHWLGITDQEAIAKYPEKPKSIYSVFNRIIVNPNNVDQLMISHNMKHDYAFPPSDVWLSNDGGKTWIASARFGSYWSGVANTIDKKYWASRNNPTDVNMEFGHMGVELSRRPEYQGNRFLSVTPAGDVYICIDQQVLRSQDWGDSWQQRDDYELVKGSGEWIGRGDSDLPGRFIMVDTGVENRMLLCCGEHGLWEVTDPYAEKVATKQLDGQIHEGGTHSLSYVTVNPKDPNVISTLSWRQTNVAEFRRSTDGGASWSNISNVIIDNESLDYTELPNLSNAVESINTKFYSLVTDYNNPNNIYFTTLNHPFREVAGPKRQDAVNNGIYKSSNNGKSWKIVKEGLPEYNNVNSIVIDPNTSTTLYATLNDKNGGLFISINEGESWSRIELPSEIESVNSLSINKESGAMYIACGSRTSSWEAGGVWCSDDRGASWRKIFEMPNIWSCCVSQVDPEVLILSSAGQKDVNGVKYMKNPGVYVSHNRGESWEKLNRGFVQVGEVSNVATDPNRADVFWCSCWGSGWYRGIYK